MSSEVIQKEQPEPSILQVVKTLPKIELHRHLEGAVRLETLIDIARHNQIEMPEYDVETLRPFVQMMPGEHRSMQNFLSKFKTIRQFFLSKEVISRIAREAVIDAAQDNIKYMELRFTPVALVAMSKAKISDAVTWVCDAVEQATSEYDVDVRLIVSMNRHESLQIGEQAVDAAIAHMDRGVVAVDLAGREEHFPASLFRSLFHRAQDAELNVTIHAGEWEGAQSIWDAVGNLGATRVGHGVRVLEDYGVLTILAQQGVVLEVCPTSNIHSGIFSTLRDHPLPELVEKGLRVTINTDDPLISDITLSDELARVMTHMRFTLEDIKRHTMIAANAAFLPDDERAVLVSNFKEWLYPPHSNDTSYYDVAST
ncbi:MAG: adenosine deaminase [Aggregatilineales bacterium]